MLRRGIGDQLPHELLRDPYGEVEIGELAQVLLDVDEIHDIGMVDTHDAHVGTPAEGTLLDRIGRLAKDLHE